MVLAIVNAVWDGGVRRFVQGDVPPLARLRYERRAAMASAGRPALETIDRFQLLIDSVDEYAIFMLDPAGVVVSWNSGAQRIKGYTADEIIGQHFSRFYPAGDVADGKPAMDLASAARLGHHRDEGRRVRRDGSQFWAYVVITAILDRGKLVGFAKVTRDETERQASDAAARLLVAEAVRANLSKDEFLSRVSHELRTPLNAIVGFGQLLHLAQLSTSDRECVEQISSAAGHLLGVIDEILDISRVGSGSLRLSMEPVSVVDVVNDATGMIAPLAERRRITMHVDLSRTRAGWHVTADRQRLRQVVLNLLSNAVKYSPDGATIRIGIDEHRHRHRLRLTLTDAGPGIDDKSLSRLFVPFERLGAEPTPIEGTGLGLALSKQLMTAMGGEIGVASSVGIGSSFWIELPLVAAPDAVAQIIPPPVSSDDAMSPSAPITVLYIEDNTANVRLMERVLELRPHVTLIVALDGHVGITRARQHQPDLILLDMHLPDLGGDEVLRRLRADPQTAATPIIMVTADAVLDHQRGLIQLGATGYMTKPIDIITLLRRIDRTPPLADSSPATATPTTTHVPSTVATGAGPTNHQRTVDADAFADFVHDLNNVLGVVVNHAELLATDVTTPRAAADLIAVRAAAERAVNLARGFATVVARAPSTG